MGEKLHAEPALCPAQEGGGIWLQGAEIDAFNVSVILHRRGALEFFSWNIPFLEAFQGPFAFVRNQVTWTF